MSHRDALPPGQPFHGQPDTSPSRSQHRVGTRGLLPGRTLLPCDGEGRLGAPTISVDTRAVHDPSETRAPNHLPRRWTDQRRHRQETVRSLQAGISAARHQRIAGSAVMMREWNADTLHRHLRWRECTVVRRIYVPTRYIAGCGLR